MSKRNWQSITSSPANVNVQTSNNNIESVLSVLERLKAENEALKASLSKTARFTLRVSVKGAVSVYGMGRFPITLYANQWETLISHVKEIQDFIETNKPKLSVKP
jgi:hypothetical protein